MREDAAKLDWNHEGTDIDEMWLSFMNNIKLLADSHIPKSKPHQISRPIYMTAKAREKEKTKNKTFHTWRRTRDGNDYRIYTPKLETKPNENVGKQKGNLRKNLPRNVRTTQRRSTDMQNPK